MARLNTSEDTADILRAGYHRRRRSFPDRYFHIRLKIQIFCLILKQTDRATGILIGCRDHGCRMQDHRKLRCFTVKMTRRIGKICQSHTPDHTADIFISLQSQNQIIRPILFRHMDLCLISAFADPDLTDRATDIFFVTCRANRKYRCLSRSRQIYGRPVSATVLLGSAGYSADVFFAAYRTVPQHFRPQTGIVPLAKHRSDAAAGIGSVTRDLCSRLQKCRDR